MLWYVYTAFAADLEPTPQAKAREEREAKKKAFLEYLRTRDDITVASQWRKVLPNIESEQTFM